MRLLGIPLGLSPNRPLSWAPMGLKYRSSTTLQSLSGTQKSDKIRSSINLVLPYGLVVDKGKSSLIGTVSGDPYTVAEELNIMRLQPYSFINSHKFSVPVILFW